jgi:hypothetical protein
MGFARHKRSPITPSSRWIHGHIKAIHRSATPRIAASGAICHPGPPVFMRRLCRPFCGFATSPDCRHIFITGQGE